VPDAAVTLALGDTVDEAMNTIQLGGTDWNDALKAYNTCRAQIKGEIVVRVSAYFGFDLSLTLPDVSPPRNSSRHKFPDRNTFVYFFGRLRCPKKYTTPYPEFPVRSHL